MTAGIYCIKNTLDNKVYVGKSINIENRIKAHKYLLEKDECNINCNRHLFNAYKKYGVKNFIFEIIQPVTDKITDSELSDLEFCWMDYYKSFDREYGYNLRRDSSTHCIMHDETRELKSLVVKGELNPNYGNNWTDEMKYSMSIIKKNQHTNGDIYNEEWKKKISKKSSAMWKDDVKKSKMAKKVSESKKLYNFLQKTKDANQPIRLWQSINEILDENPDWKWQNIYAACNGNKKSYMGFKWEYIEKIREH